jgi:general secretion pathway protein A
MYNAFYGLKENPFDITPDSKFLFWSQKHQTAFRHLLYSVQSRKGLILLTGEVGTGKTTLLAALIEFFKGPEAKTRIVYLENSKFNSDDLFRYIFNELGLTVRTTRKSDYWIRLKDFLLECNQQGEQALLILDESQNYTPDVLEEVRLLSNLETSEGKLIQIILAGQLQLMSNINKPDLYQLKQRIGISYNLRPLNREETHLYIQKRLEVAGAKDLSIFSQDSIESVYDYSKGIPRIINILCDNALLFGYATKRNQISTSVIVQVAENMDLEKLDVPNTQQYESLSEKQDRPEEIGSDKEKSRDDIIIKYAKRYNRKVIDHESMSDKSLNYRALYDEKIERERKIRKRFAWLAQVGIVSITILVVVLLANDKFFVRAEAFIQALFHSTSPVKNDTHGVAASKSEPDIPNHRPPQRQEAERRPTDVSMERIVVPSSQSLLATAAVPGESSPEQPAPTTRLAQADAKFIVVQTGDTFRAILLKRYGVYNRMIIERILEANPAVQDINTILIGQRIVLPNL